MLKPQDIVLVLKLVSKAEVDWSQGGLAQELVMSPSEINAGLKRLFACELVLEHEDGRRYRPHKQNLLEFLLYGIRYVFPAIKGAPTMGIATSVAALPLSPHIEGAIGFAPVWPHADAKKKGYSFAPLYPSVPKACLMDKNLQQLLSLVDALRDSDCEHRPLAAALMKERLSLQSGGSKVELDGTLTKRINAKIKQDLAEAEAQKKNKQKKKQENQLDLL